MFSLKESIQYFLYARPADLRMGFYTLSGIVKDRMGFDICDGAAFIFINRTLDSMKILHMGTGGLVIYHMMLAIIVLPYNKEYLLNRNFVKESRRHRITPLARSFMYC